MDRQSSCYMHTMIYGAGMDTTHALPELRTFIISSFSFSNLANLSTFLPILSSNHLALSRMAECFPIPSQLLPLTPSLSSPPSAVISFRVDSSVSQDLMLLSAEAMTARLYSI